jgi:hypothetical protein
MTEPTAPGRRPGDTVETPGAFRGRVRAWLDANAPRKGEPGDFSAAHLVSAGTSEHSEAAPWVGRLLFAPGLRLGGGTDEIQRNTIAERGLGLPREVSG